MPGEFRNKPLPSDWVLPDEVTEHMDGLGAALLSEHDIEGVPIPFGFQLTFEMGELIRQLDDEDVDPFQTVGAIIQKFDEVEDRYPDAPMWDRLRGHFVDVFVEKGHQDQAIELMWTIKSPHAFVAKMMELGEATDPDPHDVVRQIMQLEEGRKGQIIRALRDRIIDKSPSSDLLWVFNDYLLKRGIETDSIDGWVESQRDVKTQFDWSGVAQTVKDDSLWANVPTPLRQHMMLSYMDLSEEAGGEEVPNNWSEEAKDYFDMFEDAHPEVSMWSQFKSSLSLTLLDHGHNEQASQLAASIQDSGLMARVTLEFIKRKQESAAIELAAANPDHKCTADILLDAEWTEDEEAPVRKLEDIIVSDDYPVEKRIGCLGAVRDRFFENGLVDKANEYQERIDELRSQSYGPEVTQ